MMKKRKRAVLLALCYPSLILSPNAFHVVTVRRRHAPVSRTTTKTCQHCQFPLSSTKSLSTTSIWTNRQQQYVSFQSLAAEPHVTLQSTIDDEMRIRHASIENVSYNNDCMNASKGVVEKREEKKSMILWIFSVMVIFFSQRIIQICPTILQPFASLADWISSRIIQLASMMATTAATTTTTVTSVGQPSSIIFSTVSASLLRRHKQSQLSKIFQFMYVSFMVWQIISQAGIIAQQGVVYAGKFVTWYAKMLSSSPLLTKAITTGIIALIGDALAQYFELRIESKNNNNKDSNVDDRNNRIKASSSSSSSATVQLVNRYNRRRGLSVLGDGIFISGPLLHLFYNVLEDIIPVHGGGGGGFGASLAALFQVFIDETLLNAVFVAIMFITTGIAEGYTRQQIIPQFRNDFLAALKASWTASIFLIPIEFVCFRFLPLEYRVLGMNIIDIAPEAIISFLIHRSRGGNNHQPAVASS